jgi:hypothetical protein
MSLGKVLVALLANVKITVAISVDFWSEKMHSGSAKVAKKLTEIVWSFQQPMIIEASFSSAGRFPAVGTEDYQALCITAFGTDGATDALLMAAVTNARRHLIKVIFTVKPLERGLVHKEELVTIPAPVFLVVLHPLSPGLRHKLADFVVLVEVGDGADGLLAFLRLEGAIELQYDFLARSQLEGFRTLVWTPIGILFDNLDTRGAEGLATRSVAGIGLFRYVSTDGAFVLLELLSHLDMIPRPYCLHSNYSILSHFQN